MKTQSPPYRKIWSPGKLVIYCPILQIGREYDYKFVEESVYDILHTEKKVENQNGFQLLHGIKKEEIL